MSTRSCARACHAEPGAAAQLLRTEGPLAFYKGSVTHFLRLGPHMVLVFGILEQFKRLRGR